MNVLISGAGIAGPTLAYWLLRAGARPTLVEAAPRLRGGGYIIDFWGAGYDVAEKMGLIPEFLQRGYKIKEVRIVDAHGRRIGGFDAKVFARAANDRFVSLPRGDLAAAIFNLVDADVETILGDKILAIDHGADSARVSFLRSPPRNFDLVIGAGGLHSGVRAIAWGPEAQFERFLGYRVAAFEAEKYQPRDELVYVSYSIPGRQIARFSMRDDRTLFLLTVADASERRTRSIAEQKAYLHRHFDGAGWECAQIMAALDASEELYFDRVSQIELPSWHRDRLALVGDAAASPSLLAGEGASLSMAAAYVLAGELRRAGGDYEAAFRRYEAFMHPIMNSKQRAARGFAAAFAPRTSLGIRVRNLVTRAMAIPLVAHLTLGASLKDDFTLPDYSWLGG